ncbi:MAG: hypothetical protein ABI839_08130, partial [Verrucomicrobiota bacterium]
MAATSSSRPTWQRSSIFQFFSSVKLAVVLLAVLIIASIAGTIYESSFDAKVARAYVYGAPWFNLWLLLLATNLTVSALSRWPWRRHHVAFLITHLGIITLLAGSLVGRTFGVEGTMTLFKHEPPSSRLLVEEHQLRVHDSDGILKGYRAEFLHRPPTPDRPRDLGLLANGARLSIIDYAEAIDAKLNPKPLPEGGSPALHFTVKTAMMGQQLEGWLLADDQPQHASYSMGLANIELKRGRAPAAGQPARDTGASEGKAPPDASVVSAPTGNVAQGAEETEVEESIFTFAKAPDQQIARVAKGGSTGARLSLSEPGVGGQGELTVTLGDKSQKIPVAPNLGKEVALTGTKLSLRLENYWPDFRIRDGKPGSVSDIPKNPALVVTIHGRALPVAPTAPAHAGKEASVPEAGRAPVMDGANAAQNHLTLFLADDGEVTYELKSRRAGDSSQRLKLNEPLTTGWADWSLVVDRVLPHAQTWMEFTPAAAEKSDMPDGLRLRVVQKGETIEQWIPAGWEINVPTTPQPVSISYGWRAVPLPIAIELLTFEVQRNEGSDAPAGFKSTLQVT